MSKRILTESELREALVSLLDLYEMIENGELSIKVFNYFYERSNKIIDFEINTGLLLDTIGRMADSGDLKLFEYSLPSNLGDGTPENPHRVKRILFHKNTIFWNE